MNLVLAALSFAFSNGRWIIPVAAWVSPIFLLRFVRGRGALLRLITGALVSYLVSVAVWRGMIPVPGALYYAIVAAISISSFVPYVIDRLIAPRLSGFASTLVFPCAWAAVEFLITTFSPYGSWGLAAYTQADQLPLIQLVSVTGLWGVGFLIAWLGSVVNWAWEQGFDWSRVGRGAIGFAVVLTAICAWGGARVYLAPTQRGVVRVASFTAPTAGLYPDNMMGRRREGAELDSLRASLGALEDTLLDWSRREARAGARVVFWSEVNLFVLKSDEERVMARGSTLAKEERICLLMALAPFTPGEGFYENEVAVFDTSGERVAFYHKARPVPGDPERGADREIPVFATRFGRMAAAICFDLDFPQLIRKASRQGAGVILAPSSDWREIDPIHTRMALFRGIENGCAVVRQTNKGLSAAADWRGRILAWADYFQLGRHVMVAQVPVHAGRTIYSRIGDAFAYLCLVALVIFAIAALRKPTSRPAGSG